MSQSREMCRGLGSGSAPRKEHVGESLKLK